MENLLARTARSFSDLTLVFNAKRVNDWHAENFAWRDITEQQPDQDTEVLVCCCDDVFLSTYRVNQDDYGYFDIEDQVVGWKTTHWMPLPEPAQ
jgi:hypothetical protein